MVKIQPTIMTATAMQQKAGQIIRRCFREKENFVIERDGLPVVAIIPIDLYEKIRRTKSTEGWAGGKYKQSPHHGGQKTEI